MSADCKKKEQAAMQGMCGAVLHFYEKENTMEKFLQVGVIPSTHGIRGEVKVFPTTDDKERYLDLKKVLLDTGKEQIPLEIQNVRFFKQMVILKFKGSNSTKGNIHEVSYYDIISRNGGTGVTNEYHRACRAKGAPFHTGCEYQRLCI